LVGTILNEVSWRTGAFIPEKCSARVKKLCTDLKINLKFWLIWAGLFCVLTVGIFL